jgi:hypothetical protein
MPRLRTLVVAVWVVGAIAGLVAPVGAATAQDAAGRIDATGTADATAGLQALFDRTPDGGVVRLEAGGDYRVEGTLVLEGRRNLRIEGNGARIFATTEGTGSRGHLSIVGGSNLVVRNIKIRGANPHAGVDPRAYVTRLEWQHGISMAGATDVELDGVEVSDVYGDLVYMGRDQDGHVTERVWIHDSTFSRSGRQGLTVTAGRDIVIERNTITGARLTAIDLEPHPSFSAENVHILDNEFGPTRVLFMAATGPGHVDTVVVARNVLRGDVLNMVAEPPPGQRRHGFWLVDNTSDAQAIGTPLTFTRIDGLVLHGNRQSIPRPGEALVQLNDCCGVSMAGNDIAPGTLPFKGQGRSCGFDLPLDPPAAPAVAGRSAPRRVPAPTDEAPPTTPTTAPPTTEAPPTTPTTAAPTTTTETTSPSTSALEAASATRDEGGADLGRIVVAAALVLLVAGGAAVALSVRRGRT